MAAQIEWTNDGRRQHFKVLCPDKVARENALRVIVSAMAAFEPKLTPLDGQSMTIELIRPEAPADDMIAAAHAAATVLDRAGYVRMGGPREPTQEAG